jgi:hypothetical protein
MEKCYVKLGWLDWLKIKKNDQSDNNKSVAM